MIKKITKAFIKKNLPIRKKNSSKIDGGKVLIIGGGKGLYGAGILSALAATRSGAGYVYLMSDIKKFNWLKFPDFLVEAISLTNIKKYENSVIAIGAGLGFSKKKENILKYLIKSQHQKTIVDGDALTMLSRMKSHKLPESWILTPHEGELARLLNVTSQEIKKKRLHFAKVAQEKFGCVIILKGAETLIVTKEQVYCSSSGTKALAKAGSGDVLLGMIAAFYSQKSNEENNQDIAAILGCYIHGYSSKLWIDEKNDYLSMRPLDLIDGIPKAIYKLRK